MVACKDSCSVLGSAKPCRKRLNRMCLSNNVNDIGVSRERIVYRSFLKPKVTDNCRKDQ